MIKTYKRKVIKINQSRKNVRENNIAFRRVQNKIKTLEAHKFNSKIFHQKLIGELLADVDAKHHRNILLKICKTMDIPSKKCKDKSAEELAELLRLSIRRKSLRTYVITIAALLGSFYMSRSVYGAKRTVSNADGAKRTVSNADGAKRRAYSCGSRLARPRAPRKTSEGSIRVFYQNGNGNSILNMSKLNECILVDPAGTAFNPIGGGNYDNAGFLSGAIYKKCNLSGNHNLTLKETGALWNENVENVVAIVHVIGPSSKVDYYNKLKNTFISLRDVLKSNDAKNKVIALPLISGGSFRPRSISLLDYMKMFITLIREYLSEYKVVIGLYRQEEKDAYDEAVKVK